MAAGMSRCSGVTTARGHIAAMERTNVLCEALQDLLTDYTEGIVVPGCAQPWHWDVLVPCGLVEALAEASRE